MKQKNRRGTTPIGEAFFAHLIKPEEFQGKSTGKYTVMLKLTPEATEELKTAIDEEYQKFREAPENHKKKLPTDYANGIKEYKDEEYFKFGMNEEITLKDKSILKKRVPIYDANLKEISKKLEGIGNGSKIKVSYELVPFWMTKTNAGVSLRLLAVQVIDLVEYGSQSAEAYGFSAEEGYDADDNDEIPSTDTSEDMEGDF